jgi:sulfur dioxygenase
MIFRQLFEPESSTYTYLIADDNTREAILVDSVRETFDRDVEQLDSLALKLVYVVETHVHADHITGASLLRDKTGCKVGVSSTGGAPCADLQLKDGDVLRVGAIALEVRATPGHTDTCLTFVGDGFALTGDALLIRGCGRTDFQQGNPRTLYRSVREKIFTLPDDTKLYPGHDYKGRTVTTVAEERKLNARLKDGISEDKFVEIMAGLKLAPPKKIKEAVPANLVCGNVPRPASTTPSGFLDGEGI